MTTRLARGGSNTAQPDNRFGIMSDLAGG